MKIQLSEYMRVRLRTQFKYLDAGTTELSFSVQYAAGYIKGVAETLNCTMQDLRESIGLRIEDYE